MRFSFKNRLFIQRTILVFLVVTIIAGLGGAVFALEYKGQLNLLATKYPGLSFLTSLPKILDIFYLPYQLSGTDLPVYNLVVDPQDLKKLEDKLVQNPGEVLLDEYKISVPAEFIYNNQSYPVKIRVHGDLSNHWRYDKKSWRISFKEPNLFDGKSQFDLILPEDRSFLGEQLNNYRAKKLGLFVPASRFVALKINNRGWAVYFETEGWNKDFLERNERPSDANLYIENDDLAFQGYNHDLLENPAYWVKSTQDQQSRFDNFAEIDLLGRLVHQSSDDEFYRQIPDLLDMNNFLKWRAQAALAGSTRQDFIHNVRLYFNISRGKFELIPWDIRLFDRDKFTGLNYNTLVTRLLKNPEIRFQRDKLLWDYLKDDKNLEDDLKFYEETYQQVKTAFYQDGLKKYSNFYFDRKIVNGREMVISQYQNIKDTLADSQVLATVRISSQAVRLDLTTTRFSDIILEPNQPFFDAVGQRLATGFQMSSQRSTPGDYSFEEEIKVLPATYTFFLNKNDFNPEKFELKIINAVTGDVIKPTIRFVDEETFADFDKITYSRDRFLKENQIFKSGASDKEIVLGPGQFQINQSIIVPRNLVLKIQAGTELYFAPRTSLYSYSPVDARGSQSALIKFTAQDKNQGWGVFAIIDASKSVFEYCLVEYGGQDYLNGVFISGQLALHWTEGEIKNCRFQFANGDDSLNVKYARANIENNYFYKNKFDAIDFDWAKGGRIANNYFQENGNDGIDLSGAENLMVWNNRINGSGDKCISIGENSRNTTVFANNLLIGCQDGVAIKDNSSVVLVNNTIVNNKIGVAIYGKKPIFGGAHPKLVNNIIWGNEKSVEIDSKSSVEITFCDVQGGYQGEGNLNQQPFFQDAKTGNFLLLDNPENNALIRGGNLEIINNLLKDKLNKAPMGIIVLPQVIQ